MARFREHRGTLSESLATVVEVANKEELAAHLNRLYAVMPINATAENLSIKHYRADWRIGWNTYLVKVAGYGPVGFTDGPM